MRFHPTRQSRRRKKSLEIVFAFAVSLAATLASIAEVRSQNQPTTAAAAPADSPAAEQQARTLLVAGQRDAAIDLLNARAQQAPDDRAARQLLGEIYYQKNDFARAIEHLSAARTATTEAPVTQMLALAHYALGRHAEAIPLLEQLRAGAPDNTEVAYALGNSYLVARQTDKARANFARVFRVAPDSAAAYLLNAQMMIRQHFEELAEEELRRAVALDPKLPHVNFMLGEMAIYQARIDEGIAYLNKEIALNPASDMAYYRLGEALTRQLKWNEAVAPLQKALLLNPTFSGSYIVLGKVHLKRNDLENAEAMLRRAARMDPNNFSAHHLLAQVLQQAKRTDEARREFEAAERLRTITTTTP